MIRLLIIKLSIILLAFGSVNVTEELRHLYIADQKDRNFMFDEKAELNLKQMMINDSLRLERVIELDSLGLIKSIADKYYANMIFWHNRSTEVDGKLIYCEKVIQYCKEVLNEDFESKEIKDNLKLLSELIKKDANKKIKKVTENEIKIDFENFLETAKLYKIEHFTKDSTKSKNLKIATDSLDNPDYLKRLKSNVIEDTKKNLQERYGDKLTDEMIEKAAEESFRNLINTGKALQEYYRKEKEKEKKKNESKKKLEEK